MVWRRHCKLVRMIVDFPLRCTISMSIVHLSAILSSNHLSEQPSTWNTARLCSGKDGHRGIRRFGLAGNPSSVTTDGLLALVSIGSGVKWVGMESESESGMEELF
jgi:hypothetical protein